ncbi:MAG: LysM peptidoglycan-binding domain-containing protein [Candidatus Promineifilaceae bacterium]
MRKRLLILTVLAGLLWVGSGYKEQETAEAAPQMNAAEMFDLVNQFRVENGLTPFLYNSSLAFAAQRHANWMGTTATYSHTEDNGSTPLTRANDAGYVGWVSENIVGGTNMSARQGLIWWENSPIHYNTLVSTRYTEAGTGFAVTANGQNMFVLVVGLPSNAPASSSPTTEDSSAAPLIITPIQLAEPREDGSIVHVIRPGQSLWMVAAYYDADLDYLYQINGLDENDVIQPGDEIYVQLADGQPPPPTPTPRLTYLVQDGDSAWLIAARHSIELDLFLALNGIEQDTVLQPGTEVRVRLAEGEALPPTPTPPVTYKVQEGDSLWSIAAKNDLTVDQLLSLNNLTEDSFIVAGEELTIRQVEVTPTATPTAESTATPGAEAATLVAEIAPVTPGGTPVLEIIRSPTPTVEGTQPAEGVESASMAMSADIEEVPPEQSGGGSIGILIMAVSLIALAGLMLYIANRQ